MFIKEQPQGWQLGRPVAKGDDAVASASTKIYLFLDANWLKRSSFQPQEQETQWDTTYKHTVCQHIEQRDLLHAAFETKVMACLGLIFTLLEGLICCQSSQFFLSKQTNDGEGDGMKHTECKRDAVVRWMNHRSVTVTFTSHPFIPTLPFFFIFCSSLTAFPGGYQDTQSAQGNKQSL